MRSAIFGPTVNVSFAGKSVRETMSNREPSTSLQLSQNDDYLPVKCKKYAVIIYGRKIVYESRYNSLLLCDTRQYTKTKQQRFDYTIWFVMMIRVFGSSEKNEIGEITNFRSRYNKNSVRHFNVHILISNDSLKNRIVQFELAPPPRSSLSARWNSHFLHRKILASYFNIDKPVKWRHSVDST